MGSLLPDFVLDRPNHALPVAYSEGSFYVLNYLLLAFYKANITYLQNQLKVVNYSDLALYPSPNSKAGGSEMQDTNFHLLTVEEMAEILRIGRSSAYELCRQNEFPVIRIGRSIRIPKKTLLDWVYQESQAKHFNERLTI